MMSGDMADQFGNLFMAISVRYYQSLTGTSDILTDYIVDELIRSNRTSMNKIIDNMGPERYLLQHLKTPEVSRSYERERTVFKESMTNPAIMERIKDNLFIKGSILEALENASINGIDNEQVIQVGEYTM